MGGGWALERCGALASATRLAGLALAPALLWGAWKAGVRGWRLLATGLLPFGGFVAYSLYTAIWHDDPRAYFTAQENWGGWTEHVRFYAELFVRHPKEALQGDPRHLVIVLNLLLALVFLALLPLVWKRLPPAIAMFTVVTVIAHVVDHLGLAGALFRAGDRGLSGVRRHRGLAALVRLGPGCPVCCAGDLAGDVDVAI